MFSKKFLYKLTTITVPAVFIISGFIVTSFIKNSYQRTEKELILEETRFASYELAENLEQDIMRRVSMLQTVAEARPDIFPKNQSYFERTTSVIIKNSPGFFAINWIDPNGIIQWIYPVEPNLLAKGKKVIGRPELASYIEESRDTRSTRISHVVDLYQGPKGMIIYVPIYQGDEFKGWYNGVIDIKDSLDKFFELRKFHNIHVSLKWKGHEDFIYNYGTPPAAASEIQFESKILNQTLLIEVDLNKNSILANRGKNVEILFTLIYIAIGIIAIFLFYLVKSQFMFMHLNRNLSRDKILLNILTHDMATPLTLISENIKRLKEKLKNQEYPEVDRIMKSSAKQKELLTRVRSFHVANMGKIQLELLPVSTMEIINESIALYEQQLSEKEITCDVLAPDGEIYACADRITAINNVMGNVLGNAVKFSNNKSKITIRTYKYKKYVVIETEDHGKGITKETLTKIFEEDEITSTRGTMGEAGTGLGMLQIKSFMELYHGNVIIETSDTGTKVRLYFKGTNLE